MIAYEPSRNEHVGVLIAWWSSLSARDRELTFAKHLHSLAAFLDHYTARKADLMFTVDAKGIWIAAWTSPLLDAASFSCWIRFDKRHTLAAWRELQMAYAAALQVYPALIGLTRQPRLHATHLKLGYSYRGKLESALKDGPLYVYELTREAWQNRAAAAQSVRMQKRALRQSRVNGNGVLKTPISAIVAPVDGADKPAAETDDEEPSWMKRQFNKLGLN